MAPALAMILAISGVAVIAALALWWVLTRLLRSRIRSPLRAVPLCMPLLLAAVGYGLYWSLFFTSPAAAVQAHAIRLTLAHFVGPALPWIGALWFAASTAALFPLLRR